MTTTIRRAVSLLSAAVISASAASSARAAIVPPLGAASTYAVLGGASIVNTGNSVITGDLGVSPGATVSGFPPGTITGGDPDAAAAQAAITAAYSKLVGQACDTDLTGQDLGGLTLTPGTYCFSSEALLTGTLTLNAQNNPDAVWVFKIGSTLTTASGSSVVKINGAQSCAVFWQVGSSATLGTTTMFAGNILALTSITMETGATNSGGVFARTGTVTLDTNDVSAVGSCCPPIALAGLPGGVIGVPYTGTATASGGTGPYTYSVLSGTLPAGLSLDPSGAGAGAITGTPSAFGTFTFQIAATDTAAPGSCVGLRSYNLVISPLIGAGDLVIREFRWRGPLGAEDEYVEVFNQSLYDLVIWAPDGSAGFGIVSESGSSLLTVIPNLTVILRGGSFLAANITVTTGYSLENYGGTAAALPDANWTVDVADNSGVGLFRSTVTFDVPNRIDAVGFSGSAALYREGSGLTPATGIADGGQWLFVRRAPYPSGALKDTGDNAADFRFGSTDASIYSAVQSALGTPGPQNLAAARSIILPSILAEPSLSSEVSPNRVQVGNYHYFRRKVTNDTGVSITKLRFRIADLTTLYGDGYGPGQADWRGITTGDVSITLAGSLTVTAKGLTLEAPTIAYSATGRGAGYNASFVVDLSDIGGSLADGASIYLNVGFRNKKGGHFIFILVPEILPE